jgi:hypothetical protein
VKTILLDPPADGIMAGVSARLCDEVIRIGRRSGMTDRRDEERGNIARNEDDERREERERRSAELMEAWRRRHPDEEERKRGRQGREGKR